MFRNSVSFFVLVALFWILVWIYIPDISPGTFSFTDALRLLPLLFSFSAFMFALMMLFIRYFGVDIISKWIPHAGIVWWLGQRAYRYSQPSITLNLNYIGHQKLIKLNIQNGDQKFSKKLTPQSRETVNIGSLRNNPDIRIKYPDKTTQEHLLNIQHLVKRLGKNMTFEVDIDDSGLTYHRYQNQVVKPPDIE